MTRRCFLKLSATAVFRTAVLRSDSAERPPSPKSRPLISGTLWGLSSAQLLQMGVDGWRKELDQQQAIGFNLLWLSQVSGVAADPVLRQLLDLCEQRKIQVILDAGGSGRWYQSLDLKQELEICRKHIRAVGERFAGHPAFYAWYIPHEIYMCWGRMDEYIQQLYPALTEACKKAAKLPVTLSPFFILDRTKVFGDFQFNEPDEYRQYWAALIKKSAIDVIMLQDSGEHFSYVTNDQRRPFLEGMSAACAAAGARFWANVEVAEMECASIEEYVRLYGRVHHSAAKGIPWRPVPMPRLRAKLELAAQYAERIVSWGYQQFCRPELGPKAAEWYRAYREYVKNARTVPVDSNR